MNNLTKHIHAVTKSERESLLNQKSFIVWLTGLSGSGKSTIANELSVQLQKENKLAYILDGDNVRSGLNSDLKFSDKDRKENIRRISEVAKLMSDTGVIVIVSFISPFKEDREQAKKIIGNDNFIEVYINTSLEICEERDVKGLYKKARNGEIPNFTGIDSPYEEPERPDIILEAGKFSIKQCVDKLRVQLEINKK